MKKSVRFLAFLLCVSLFASLIPLHSGADGATETAEAVMGKPYVEEGLAAWFDGINNSNGKHDAEAEYWKDLSGNVSHLDLWAMIREERACWEDNTLFIRPETGAYLELTREPIVSGALAKEAYTLELAVKDIVYSAEAQTLTLLSTANGEMEFYFDVSDPDNIRLIYRNRMNDICIPVAEGAEAYLHESTITVTYDETLFDGTEDGQGTPNLVLYVNGKVVAAGESSRSMCPDYVYLGHVKEAHRWGGGLYGLRFYDRALTAEEVAENAAADDFNYRQGNEIILEEKYDPSLDYYYGSSGMDISHIRDLIREKPHFPVGLSTNMIPRGGQYAAVNLVNRIYGDNVGCLCPPDWYGARIKRADSDAEEGSPEAPETADVSFALQVRNLYDLTGVEPFSGKQARYAVLRAKNTDAIESITVRVVGYDADTDAEIVYQEKVRPEAYGYYHKGYEYFLVFIQGKLDDAEWIDRVEVTVPDMGRNDEFYLHELSFFEDAIEMERYGVSIICINPGYPVKGYTADRLVFDKDTDMIPLTGFYGSTNLLDHLYPREGEEVWEGAKLMKTEENETDVFNGSEITAVSFDIMYQAFCTRAGITPVGGDKARYIVIKLAVEDEFEDLNIKFIGFDEDTKSDVVYSTGSRHSGIDFDKEGEDQYLIFDVEGIFDDCEQIIKMYVDIAGMTRAAVIYLKEIVFFENEAEAYEYAGYEPVDSETDTTPDRIEQETDADTETSLESSGGTDRDTQTVAVCPPDTFGGCSSAVGMGAVAVLMAAACVILRKRED